MTDLRPLLLLLERHERSRDEALAAQRAGQAASVAAAAQAAQLHHYRGDYEQRWATRFRAEARIEIVHCYQGFADRLSSAVTQQADVVANAARRLDQATTAVRDAELRCASVRRLIERRLLEQHQHAERREQKQADDLAARAAWLRIGTAAALARAASTTP